MSWWWRRSHNNQVAAVGMQVRPPPIAGLSQPQFVSPVPQPASCWMLMPVAPQVRRQLFRRLISKLPVLFQHFSTMRSKSTESFGASALGEGDGWCRMALVSFGTKESRNGNCWVRAQTKPRRPNRCRCGSRPALQATARETCMAGCRRRPSAQLPRFESVFSVGTALRESGARPKSRIFSRRRTLRADSRA